MKLRINRDYITNLLISYLVLFFPILLATGSFFVNLVQVIICFHGIYVLFKKKIKFETYIYILLILFIYSFLNTVINNNYYYIKNSFIFIKIFLFILSFNFLFYYKYLSEEKLLKVFNIILIIFLFDVFYQFYFEKNILGFEIEQHNKIRLTSFFKNEYVVGGFLFRLFYPIVIYQIFINKNNLKKKIFFFILFALLNICIILSGERSSLIFIFTFFLIFSIFYAKLRKSIFFLLMLFSILFVFINISNPKLQDRLINQTFDKTFRLSSDLGFKNKFMDNHYMAIYLSSYEIWKENILFGNGIRSYRLYSCNNNEVLINKIEKFSNHAHFICSTHPHNYILELLVDLGLVGLILWILFMILIVIEINKINKLGNLFCSFMGINFLVIFWPLNVHGSMFSSWNSSFYLFILAILFCQKRIFKI